jgi:hypothetical protein
MKKFVAFLLGQICISCVSRVNFTGILYLEQEEKQAGH